MLPAYMQAEIKQYANETGFMIKPKYIAGLAQGEAQDLINAYREIKILQTERAERVAECGGSHEVACYKLGLRKPSEWMDDMVSDIDDFAAQANDVFCAACALIMRF